MEKIDLSTKAHNIQDAYNKVVRGDPAASYVVYSVSRSATLDVSETGTGDLDEFLSHFSDGSVQFGLSRVIVPGSDVSKNVLLGWCPDNAPAKARMSFASNFADVARSLSGYHIQITARDQDDLDAEDILHRVGAAAGARYSVQASGGPVAKKPAPVAAPVVAKAAPAKPAAAKPSFVPKTTGKPVVSVPFAAKKSPKLADDDEWGGENAIEERDFSQRGLDEVPLAYKPTKVDIVELRKQKSDTISLQPKPAAFKASEDAEKKDLPPLLASRVLAYTSNDDGRLTELPKPKVTNSVGSRFQPAAAAPSFGAKPSFGTTQDAPKENVGFSRSYASEGGKTPAQIWAEKRGKYKNVASSEEPARAEESQTSGPGLSDRISQLNVSKETEDELPPAIIKPVVFGAPAPSKFSAAAAEEEEEEEEKTAPAPVSSLPARNLPPPPARNEPEEEENEAEEEVPEEKPAPTPSLPVRNLPSPPVRTIPATVPVAKEEPVAPVLPKGDEPAAPSLPERDEPKKATKSAVAEYDYEKDEDNEISFAEGDLIVEIDFVDEEWWSGKHSKTGESGLFPASYVSLKEEEASETSSTPAVSVPVSSTPVAAASEPAKSDKTATAEYDYEKDEDNEIAFAEGDVIVEIEFVDEDWWSGKHSKTGETGLFPANYVSLNK